MFVTSLRVSKAQTIRAFLFATATWETFSPRLFLIFTVESYATPIESGFKINPHGRFSHTESYLHQVLADSQLNVLEIKPVVLRYEISSAVDGFLVIARAPTVSLWMC